MQHKSGFLAVGVGAAALIVLAMTLAPAVIGVGSAGQPNGGASHSWVADAFPIGQASFARSGGGGN